MTFLTLNKGQSPPHPLQCLQGVLTNTIPATLTAALSTQGALPDPTTGLVHLGGGQWYDPSLGRPLQPNSLGGPASVPQALNRAQRAATSMGQPGVGEAASSSLWLGFAGAIAAESTQSVVGLLFERPFSGQILQRSVATGKGTLFLTAHYRSLEKGGVTKYFASAYPSSYLVGKANVFRTKGLVRPLGNGRFFDFETGDIFGLSKTAVYGERSLVTDLNPVFAEQYVVREFVEDSAGKWLARNAGIPFIADFGFQLAGDWSNSRLTWDYKFYRAGVSGGIGVIGGGIVYLASAILVGAIPPGELLFIGGIIFGIFVENPVSEYINERVFPEKPLNLRPLQ